MKVKTSSFYQTIKLKLDCIYSYFFVYTLILFSYAHLAGTYIRTVAGKLGHTKTFTIVDTYAQFVQAAEKRTADTMEALLQSLKPNPAQKNKAGINRLYMKVYIVPSLIL